MELAIGIAALAIIGLVVVVFQQSSDRADLLSRFEAERQSWIDERRELLNRLQHPERMPVKQLNPGAVRSNVSPETRRALAQVGTVAPQTVTDGD